MAPVEPSLKDIAAAAGVHAMTASRALRNTGRMRPGTRQRVLAAAQQLGYRPHAAAAAMRTGRSGCLVLVSDPRQPALRLDDDAFGGMIECAAARGSYLALARFAVPSDNAESPAWPAILRHRLGDGVLVNDASDQAAARVAGLRAIGLPVVWIHRRQADATPVIDGAAGMGAATAAGLAQQAVERLIDLVEAGERTMPASAASPEGAR